MVVDLLLMTMRAEQHGRAKRAQRPQFGPRCKVFLLGRREMVHTTVVVVVLAMMMLVMLMMMTIKNPQGLARAQVDDD